VYDPLNGAAIKARQRPLTRKRLNQSYGGSIPLTKAMSEEVPANTNPDTAAPGEGISLSSPLLNCDILPAHFSTGTESGARVARARVPR
jgi:hypothetical protein